MHLQTLSSGSQGNSTLVRAGETHLLVDAGLPFPDLKRRLDDARVALRRIDHVALTHGHLDHARAAGVLALKSGARLHCCERLMSNASVRRAPTMSTLSVGQEQALAGPRGDDALRLRAVKIPHDADPTVAFLLEHEGRRAAVVTDMGRPDVDAAKALAGAHVVLLEFNHDAELLRDGPYTAKLKRRVGGPLGHLSNDEACEMLRHLAGTETHTLVLAHLSANNNTPSLAVEAARNTLAELDMAHVQIVVASQHEVGPNLRV